MAFLFGSRKKTPEQLVDLAATALSELAELADDASEAEKEKVQGDLQKRLSQMVALLMASPQDDVPADAALVQHRPGAGVSLVELLVRGYERSDTALYTGSVLREAVKHEVVCREVLTGNGTGTGTGTGTAPSSPPLFWRFFPAEGEEDRAVRAVTAGMSSDKAAPALPAIAAAPAPAPVAPPRNQSRDKGDNAGAGAGAGGAAVAGADADESKEASPASASASAPAAAAAATTTATTTTTTTTTSEDQPMGYLQLPNFEAASDAFATLRALLTSTANKSLVAQFLKPLDVDNPPPSGGGAGVGGAGGGAAGAAAAAVAVAASGGDGGHPDAYSTLVARFKVLLMSSNFMVVLQSLKLLADVILEPKNFHVMMRFIASNSNLVMMMKLLGRKHAKIQFEAFHIFKVFVANPDKRPGIVGILKTNKDKLIRFLGDFHTEKDSDEFKQEKALLIRTLKKL